MRQQNFDVVVLGAGAAGMFCAIEAGKRGRTVAVLDHAKAPGEKIRISGGGRCNFTNLHCAPKAFLSHNPHFAKSALSRYTQHDFVDLVRKHGIAFHEKAHGQLFCDGSSKEIISMLVNEMHNSGAMLSLETEINSVSYEKERYLISTSKGNFSCTSLVVATGGKSIPKMGATGLGYKLAEQFGLSLIEPRPALVPFTLTPADKARFAALSGLSTHVRAQSGDGLFEEAMLFTHRGLSGPAMLQVSSYWREGKAIDIDLLPGMDGELFLLEAKKTAGKQSVHTPLSQKLPKALAQLVSDPMKGKNLADVPDQALKNLAETLHHFKIKPEGTEGYRTAEVTLGGVNTNHLDQKTMMVKNQPGLYFIGEVVDVTGWLGGYNFQWAWSSGWVAGQSV